MARVRVRARLRLETAAATSSPAGTLSSRQEKVSTVSEVPPHVPHVTYCFCLPSKSSFTSRGRLDVLSSCSSRSLRRSQMSCASCCSLSSWKPSRLSLRSQRQKASASLGRH